MSRALSRQGRSDLGRPVPLQGEAAPPLEAVAKMIMSARQDYLNALPIAAAIVVESHNQPVIVAANAPFDLLDGVSLSAGPEEGDSRPLIEREPLRSKVRAFLLTDHGATQFDWHDGGGVGGRHFIVRMARLTTSADQERRCVLSLVDRTA